MEKKYLKASNVCPNPLRPHRPHRPHRPEGGGGLGTHWKPLNTSKTLARAARKYFSKALATATGSVGGWHGGGDSAGCGGGGGGGEGGGGLGTHWKPLNTSKTLARAGGVGGGGVEAVVRAVGAWGR